MNLLIKFFFFVLCLESSLFSMETALVPTKINPLSVENPKDLVSIFDHQKKILKDLVQILPMIGDACPETSILRLYLDQKTNQLENIINANRFYKKEIDTLLPETLKIQAKKCKENLRQSAVILEDSRKIRLEQEAIIMEVELLQEKNKYSFSFCQTLTLIAFSVSIGAYFF